MFGVKDGFLVLQELNEPGALIEEFGFSVSRAMSDSTVCGNLSTR